MILKFNNQIRNESEAQIIELLQRKGWVEYPQPEFNQDTHSCALENGEWVVSPKTPLSLEEVLSKGFFDDATSIRLRATEDDQNRYGRLVLLSQLGLTKGYISLETEQSIWDFDGEERRLTTSDLLGLILRYGFWCKQVYDLYD